MKKQEKHIKKIIQKAQPESISNDFTKKVMNKVNAQLKEQVLDDHVLKSYLQAAGLEKPEQGFNAKVFAGIHLAQHKYKPIISRPAWYVIFTSITALILYAIFYGSDQSEKANVISRTLSEFTGLLTQIKLSNFESSQISSILMISVFSLITLVFFDFILRYRKFQF